MIAMSPRSWPVVAWLACLALPLAAADYRAPAGEKPAVPRPGALSVLPGGRLLRPYGHQYPTGPGTFRIAVARKGNLIATADTGPFRYSVTLLYRDKEGWTRVRHLNAPLEGTEEALRDTWRTVSQGLVFADDEHLFVSEGASGNVRWVRIEDGQRIHLFELNRPGQLTSFSGDLAYDARRKLLYVLDPANSRVVVFHTGRRKPIGSVQTGPLPFALALSPGGHRLFVTHSGMFHYQLLPGVSLKEAETIGLLWPAFAFPSPEARQGAQLERPGGKIQVPGLGEPHASQAGTVCVINVEKPEQPRVERWIRTGTPWGEQSAGPSGTSHLLIAGSRIFVSNSLQDSVSIIDGTTLEVTAEIPIRVPGFEQHRGVIPAGMAYYERAGWLLVAEAGLNAIGVIDVKDQRVLGHIPTAWFPVDVAVTGDRVWVANALGHGFGANASLMAAVSPEKELERFRGAVTTFVIPDAAQLAQLTRQVWELNGLLPLKREQPPAYPDQLRYVVLIVKENRSFDEIFGDVQKAANGTVDGAPLLARFGQLGDATPTGPGFPQRFGLRGVNITPNHHALASQYAFSDNFYSDAISDVEGHLWLNGAYPVPWARLFLSAPMGRGDVFTDRFSLGRLQFASTHSALQPEQLPQTGSLWHHLARHGIRFASFGLGLDLASIYRRGPMLPAGGRYLANVPLIAPLFEHLSRQYPGFNPSIPDVYRAEKFIEEVRRRYLEGDEPFPQFVAIHLPNDRLDQPRESIGFPYQASYMADNDVALGRIVEFLSQTPWWRNMVIFITEDDATGGLDHVNAQRIPLLIVSPWAKQNYVSHRNTSFPGLLKTIFQILKLPPLHLWDAVATDLSDCFTNQPRWSPYRAQNVLEPLFDPARAISQLRQSE